MFERSHVLNNYCCMYFRENAYSAVLMNIFSVLQIEKPVRLLFTNNDNIIVVNICTGKKQTFVGLGCVLVLGNLDDQNKGIGDAGSTADIRMLWSAIVCVGLL